MRFISLAKRLGVIVTAEGVETVEQARYLTARSCNELQGFLFGPAVAASEIEGLIARGFIKDDHGTASEKDLLPAHA